MNTADKHTSFLKKIGMADKHTCKALSVRLKTMDLVNRSSHYSD